MDRMSETGTATAAIRGDEGFGPKGWGGYPWLWTATAVSSFGDGVRLTALPLLAVTYTRDPALLALVTVAGLLPMLLSPLAGVAADRWPRRMVIINADLARLLLVGGLAVAVVGGFAGFWLVCAVALLLGVGEVLFTVTSQTFLPEVVHPTRMTSAYGRQYAAQVVFRETVGQPVGGLLFAVGAAVPFVVDAASFLVGVLLLTAVRTAAPEPAGDAGPKPRWAQMVRQGYRYLRDDRLLLLLAGMLGYLNFFIAGASALMVVYVLDWLRLDREAFGFFLAAGAIGGVLGGLLGARLQRRLGLFPAALSGLLLTGVSFLLLGIVRDPVAAAVVFLVMTFGGVVYQTLTVSFRQTTVPRAVLGRVNGAYRLIGTGPAPVGALVAGLIARQFGVQVPFLIGGAAVLLLLAVAARPVLRLGAATPAATPS
jgi:MFS family permease